MLEQAGRHRLDRQFVGNAFQDDRLAVAADSIEQPGQARCMRMHIDWRHVVARPVVRLEDGPV